MIDLSISLQIPENLIQSFSNNNVVAFVGAGLSINEGLPSWKALIQKMLQENIDDLNLDEKESVNNHIEKGEYLTVAGFLRSKMSDISYRQFIQEQFSLNVVGELHKMLINIPFRGILTTNFDDLLSLADPQKKFGDTIKWNDNEIIEKISNKKFLIHTHGIVNSPDSIILTASDFERLNYDPSNIQFWTALGNIFTFNKVLFIGYSLNDPDLNSLLAKLKYICNGKYPIEHHILIAEDNKPDILNEHRIKTLGIRPIKVSGTKPIQQRIKLWLEKLSREVTNLNYGNGHKLTTKKINTIDSLKNDLIQFLIQNYTSKDQINELNNSSGLSIFYHTGDNLERFWYKNVYELPTTQLRNLSQTLHKAHKDEKLFIRILSHTITE